MPSFRDIAIFHFSQILDLADFWSGTEPKYLFPLFGQNDRFRAEIAFCDVLHSFRAYLGLSLILLRQVAISYRLAAIAPDIVPKLPKIWFFVIFTNLESR